MAVANFMTRRRSTADKSGFDFPSGKSVVIPRNPSRRFRRTAARLGKQIGSTNTHGANSEATPLSINSGTSCLEHSGGQRYLNPNSSVRFVLAKQSNTNQCHRTHGRQSGNYPETDFGKLIAISSGADFWPASLRV